MTCFLCSIMDHSCNMFIMQSCINPPPYIFESVIAGAVCVVASQHWPPFTWAKDIRSFRYPIKYHPSKSEPIVKKKNASKKKNVMKPPTSLTCATFRFDLKLLNQNSRSQSLKLLQATRALKVTKTCRFRYSLAATGGPSVRSSELLWKWWKEFKQAKHVPAYASLVEFVLETEKNGEAES